MFLNNNYLIRVFLELYIFFELGLSFTNEILSRLILNTILSNNDSFIRLNISVFAIKNHVKTPL